MKKSTVIQSDFSLLEGTQCFCSQRSAATIREMVASIPLDAVHYIGTGDYHYVTLFFLERIEEDFCLVLFDNHPDNQESAFGPECLSCGSWILNAQSLPHCRSVFWNSLPEKDGNPLPLYLSIDLDVLSREYARTDWDQGEMTLDFLTEQIRQLHSRCRIIGTDICGGITPSKGGTPEDESLNRMTIEKIASI